MAIVGMGGGVLRCPSDDSQPDSQSWNEGTVGRRSGGGREERTRFDAGFVISASSAEDGEEAGLSVEKMYGSLLVIGLMALDLASIGNGAAASVRVEYSRHAELQSRAESSAAGQAWHALLHFIPHHLISLCELRMPQSGAIEVAPSTIPLSLSLHSHSFH